MAWAINKMKEKNRLTNVKMGQILGVNKNTVAAYGEGKGNLKGIAIASIVKHFGIDAEWLTTGKGEPFPGAREDYREACGPESAQVVIHPDIPPDEFVFIRQMRGKISAGGGIAPDNAVNMVVAFRKDWVAKKGSPDRMSLIKVQGDSMEPTLSSGDLVLVNHSRTVVLPQGGIYAIAIDDEIMIKRIQPLFHEKKLKIISDNSRYETIEVDPVQIRINGRAIWYGREIEKGD